MGRLTVAVVQGAAVSGRPDRSCHRYNRLLGNLTADIILLPELALTGYDATLDYRTLAEGHEDATAGWAATWARTLDALLVVGMPLAADDLVLNAALMVLPNGSRHTYAKRHPWGGEAEQFAAGAEPPPVLSFRGAQVAPLICYDMTFASETADLAGLVDVLLAPSAWPWMSRAHAAAGPDLARAIATQLQCAVAWSNQTGRCRVGSRTNWSADRGAGRSLVTLPYRQAEARCPARGAAFATLTIDLDRLRHRRREKLAM
ncbi:MAG: carbon-nitrogen hydrolase family protein [Acidobacteria bacterium]|nr:carbon-nitrogen hydrolase family protein [Acidobacteriota bacterium]